MKEFILIFRHEDGKKLASPEQMQIWMKQTRDWMGSIAAQNKLVGGNGLPLTKAGLLNQTMLLSMDHLVKLKKQLVVTLLLKPILLTKQWSLQRGARFYKERAIV